MTAVKSVWLLTVEYEHDGDIYTMSHRSLHSTKDKAKLRLFDAIYGITAGAAEPDNTYIVAAATREDGAEFADLAAGPQEEKLSYSIFPLVVDGPA